MCLRSPPPPLRLPCSAGRSTGARGRCSYWATTGSAGGRAQVVPASPQGVSATGGGHHRALRSTRPC
eukprot:1621827-Pyramimonas_sp.AAC.1